MTTNEKTAAWLGLAARAALAALALALGVTAAKADPNNGNNTGTFTVRITPDVDLGVTVDTTGAAWAGSANLDVTMAVAAESILGTGVKLTVAGNFNNQELLLSATNLDTWTLDADETPGADSLRLYAMVGANQATAPGSALFNGATNLLGGTPARAGQAQADEGGDNTHKYEFATGAGAVYADVDGMAVSTARRLWLRANTPSTTSTDEQARFTVTVTAVTGRGL